MKRKTLDVMICLLFSLETVYLGGCSCNESCAFTEHQLIELNASDELYSATCIDYDVYSDTTLADFENDAVTETFIIDTANMDNLEMYTSYDDSSITPDYIDISVFNNSEWLNGLSDNHIHNYREIITKSSSCTESGEYICMCECGAMYTGVIPAKGHNTVNGICIACGETSAADAVSDIKVQNQTEDSNVNVGCEYISVETASCASIENIEFETEIIEISENTDTDEICEYIEETENDCIEQSDAVNAATTYEIVLEHIHIWQDNVTKEPNCTEEGLIERICSCGEIQTEIIPPAGHDFQYAVRENRTTYLKCTVCGYYCEEHAYEVIDEIIPTCTEGGYKKYQCTICGDILKENLNPTHTYDSAGMCIYCGYVDSDIYTAHGRYLSTTGLTEYEKMMDIVNFVCDNCHGDCIQCSYAAKSAAKECGLAAYYVHVNEINCPVLDVSHYGSELFEVTGFCEGCGMGNNHHWIRFNLSNGDWYEFDIQGLGTYCAGPNIEVHQAFYNMCYE